MIRLFFALFSALALAAGAGLAGYGYLAEHDRQLAQGAAVMLTAILCLLATTRGDTGSSGDGS